MLSTQEIADYLVKGLDSIGKTLPDPYEFSILAESGSGYVGDKVNGIVKTVSPELAPYSQGYVEAKYEYIVGMFVSGPEDIYYLTVNDIINKFIEQRQNSSVAFENGKGIITFTMGVPQGYKIEYELGEGVTLTFRIHVTYTENGVASADKHWLLDGEEIPFLSESVAVERDGIKRQIYTEVYSKILLTGQTKFYTFRIPYESNTFKMLQAEILNTPAVNKEVHTLTYYDGEAFTKNNPYKATVSVYRSAKSESTAPNASAYEVTFSDVYNAAGQALKYYISLIDFPFDMQGDDTRYFGSTAAQREYFESKAASSSAPFIEIEAPNLEGLVITKQVYRAPAPSAVSQFDYVSKNYAIIKVVSVAKTYYFYYFIENATIGADGCILVDLKMDTVQTYFFDENITFSDCLIERAHLDRFVPDPDNPNYVRFVTNPASKIYNSEQGLNFPKRLISREKLKLRFTGNDEVDNWLNENVAYWVYVFIDPTKQYNLFELISSSAPLKAQSVSLENLGHITYPTGLKGATNCVAYPIFKVPHKHIYCRITDYSDPGFVFVGDITKEALEHFETHNNDTSFYYSIKISIIPPFSYGNIVHVIDGNLQITGFMDTTVGVDTKRCVAAFAGGGKIIHTNERASALVPATCLLVGIEQSEASLTTFDYYLLGNGGFIKEEITAQQEPSIWYNPKLYSQNFRELVVTASSGDTFAYDVQKLNNNAIVFEYSEPITPEITKYYLRVQGGTGLYAKGTDESYLGLVGSTDNSLAYTNDQYAAFIANNKNFYLQSNTKMVAGAVKSGIGIVGQAARGNVAGAVTSGLTAGIDAATSIIDRELTVDNMKNAPDQLKNANGNVIFNMFCTDLGLYVEEYSALEGDLKTANDFMNLWGFSFNSIANVKDYTNIRKYHNYVKAQLQSINGNLSNAARTDLRQRFANGVRFWNGDTVEYKWENYEQWLCNDS